MAVTLQQQQQQQQADTHLLDGQLLPEVQSSLQTKSPGLAWIPPQFHHRRHRDLPAVVAVVAPGGISPNLGNTRLHRHLQGRQVLSGRRWDRCSPCQ